MKRVVITKTVGEMIGKALEDGLLLIPAGGNVIRFIPPLMVEEEQIDLMIEKLEQVLKG